LTFTFHSPASCSVTEKPDTQEGKTGEGKTGHPWREKPQGKTGEKPKKEGDTQKGRGHPSSY